MAEIVDDKSPLVIPFILQRLEKHRAVHGSKKPFFIGLNGIQGVGKTTLVNTLAQTLSRPPHSLPTLTFSIDDLYLPFSAQNALASSYPENSLVQHRGQPSTHDITLGLSLFRAIHERENDVRVPSYDKSAHSGRGDRRPEAEWDVVNRSEVGKEGQVQVVVFEGWCVGFRPLSQTELFARYAAAVKEATSRQSKGEPPGGRLGRCRFKDICFVNDALEKYDALTDQLDAFVFLDAGETHWVYNWRLEQEKALRKEKGESGAMTDEQVRQFVDGYYPAYELFTDRLREGVFKNTQADSEGGRDSRPLGSQVDRHGAQLRVVVGRDRRVVSHEIT